jgi:hypothetical protein
MLLPLFWEDSGSGTAATNRFSLSSACLRGKHPILFKALSNIKKKKKIKKYTEVKYL